MDPGLFTKLMDELRHIGFFGRISYHFYNEPLLHSDLDGIVRQTRAALPKAWIEIYTNGTLLTYERIGALFSSGASSFVVTRHENEKNYVFGETYKKLNLRERARIKYRPHSEMVLTNRGGLLRGKRVFDTSKAPCLVSSLIVTITLTGNVLACFEDYNEALVMGNLKDERLLDIWNSDRYVRFRNQLKLGNRGLYGPCKNCDRYESLVPSDVRNVLY